MNVHARISVVVPVYNEEAGLPSVLRRALDDERCDVTVVDGGSTDQTVEAARRCGVDVVRAPRGRATQMNAGAVACEGDVLLFLHGDTLLPDGYGAQVRRTLVRPNVVAGAFPLEIDGPEHALRLVERAVNWRSRRRQMPYGDQTLFLPRAVFDAIGGFPDLPVMEDYEMARRLRRRGRIGLADTPVRTSGRRWRTRGVWRTTILNQVCIAAYRMGVRPQRIAAWRTGIGCEGDPPAVQCAEPTPE